MKERVLRAISDMAVEAIIFSLAVVMALAIVKYFPNLLIIRY